MVAGTPAASKPYTGACRHGTLAESLSQSLELLLPQFPPVVVSLSDI